MRRLGTFSWAHFRPSPHGEGGLKSPAPAEAPPFDSPSPHGEGGLKYGPAHPLDHLIGSLPAWGGWIEIKPNSL